MGLEFGCNADRVLADVAARNMAAIVATTAEPAPDPAPAQWRLESVDDPSAAIKLDICAGCTIGRVEVYNTSGEGEAPAEYINYMSREQVVLKLNQLMPDLLSCESKGLNPTGVQRCGSDSWTWLSRGERNALGPGDVLALDKKRSHGSVFALRKGSPPANASESAASGTAASSSADAASSPGKRAREPDAAASTPEKRPCGLNDLLESFRHHPRGRPGSSGSSGATSARPAASPDAFYGHPGAFASNNNKADQAWMFPLFKVQRAPSLFINGTKYVDPKALPEELPRRRRESKFFLTINPNKVVPNDLTETANAAFEAGILCVEQSLASECRCFQFGPKHPEHFANDKYEDVIIGKPEFKWRSEVGPNNGRLHAHAIVTVHHYSQIHLYRSKIGELFKGAYHAVVARDAGNGGLRVRTKLMIMGNPYVSIELMPQSNHEMIMMQYMFKDSPSACPSA